MVEKSAVLSNTDLIQQKGSFVIKALSASAKWIVDHISLIAATALKNKKLSEIFRSQDGFQ